MQDKELYGLELPWRVVNVVLDTRGREVRVEIENEQKRLPSPVCAAAFTRHDTRRRRWRHLDTCQFQTTLEADVSRVNCRRHGVKQVLVPWADRGSRFTAMFEMLVVSWLQEVSIKAVAELFGLSWNVIDGIMERAVRRGIKRQCFEEGRGLPKHLGIDETSFQKRHEYVTVICDQEKGHVVHVAAGRSASAVEEYLDGFDEESRAAVETVAMDMWQAYINAVDEHIPGSETKICFYKFHMAQHFRQRCRQSPAGRGPSPDGARRRHAEGLQTFVADKSREPYPCSAQGVGDAETGGGEYRPCMGAEGNRHGCLALPLPALGSKGSAELGRCL